jgi:hypothetical protein
MRRQRLKSVLAIFGPGGIKAHDLVVKIKIIECERTEFFGTEATHKCCLIPQTMRKGSRLKERVSFFHTESSAPS